MQGSLTNILSVNPLGVLASPGSSPALLCPAGGFPLRGEHPHLVPPPWDPPCCSALAWTKQVDYHPPALAGLPPALLRTGAAEGHCRWPAVLWVP